MPGGSSKKNCDRRYRPSVRTALRLGALAVLAALVLLTVPVARGQERGLALAAYLQGTGYIHFVMVGPPGDEVVVQELIDGKLRYVLTAKLSKDGIAQIQKARRWRCDRLVRRFVATSPQPDGSTVTRRFPVRTPSCGERLEVAVPERVPQGRPVRVRVRDRWGIGGVSARLCSASRRPLTCKPVVLERGRRRYATTLPPPGGGSLLVVLEAPAQRIARRVRIGGARGDGGAGPGVDTRPTILAAGDSLMLSLDQILRDRLADRARVVADTQVGTGLSKRGFDWLAHARQTVRRQRPTATVMFLGGNEGWPMKVPGGETARCCGEAWIDAYARRARRVMSVYARGGAASVVWLRLPAPRDPEVASVWFAVNEALERAATGLPTVHTLPLDELLSPGWRYRTRILYRGRRVRVRLWDGAHLTLPGARIAAGEVIRALRRASGI